MNMDFIKIDKEKCVGCGACLKVCPATEANVVQKAIDGELLIDVKQDKCIGCGKCINVCKRNARKSVDDIDEFMQSLKGKRKIALLVSSEFKFSFNGNWKGVLDWFKKQGITQIYDGAFGAEIHAWATAKAIKNSDMSIAISSSCSAVTNLLLQDAAKVSRLVPVYGPDACMLLYIKRYLNNNTEIAVLSPCLAEKQELSEIGAKYFITCDSLAKYLKQQNIVINPEPTQTASYNFMEKQGWFGSLMAMTGGFACNLDYMQPENPSIVITASGDEVNTILDDYFKLPDFKKLGVFDLNMCGGCTQSACAAHTISEFEAKRFYRGLSLESADMREITGGRFGKGRHKDELYEYFEENLKSTDFRRKYAINKSAWKIPKKAELEGIYKEMCLKPDEYALDCGLCGYSTCEMMATAIHNKQNVCDNCIMYARRKGTDDIESTKPDFDFEEITGSTFKLYADVEEIKTSIREIKAKSGISKDMAVAIDKLLTNMLNTCQMPTFELSMMESVCDALDKLKRVVAALTTAMTAANANAEIVDEAVMNITEETQHLSKMLAVVAGISPEEMGERVEKARTTLNIVGTEDSENPVAEV